MRMQNHAKLAAGANQGYGKVYEQVPKLILTAVPSASWAQAWGILLIGSKIALKFLPENPSSQYTTLHNFVLGQQMSKPPFQAHRNPMSTALDNTIDKSWENRDTFKWPRLHRD